MDNRALTIAIVAGTIAQLAMVISGHFYASIAALFAVLGMTISLAAGLEYGFVARHATLRNAALGGLIAGGVCALIGIAVSWFLGDVTATILVFGTLSSAVAGAIGGPLGRLLGARLLPSTPR